MLQHNKKIEKAQPNTFIDGVHVKISEQYKPPRRVVLPVSCQNCSPGEALYSEYDFTLEQNIISKLAEWKKARHDQAERRNERLKAEGKGCEDIEQFSNVSIGPTQNEGLEQKQRTLSHKLTDSVLTPVCAKQNSPSQKPVSSKFNLSDFESDNSSPFDNMELQTINDMEVLASILSTNSIEKSLHNNNNNIINKDLGKNCIVLNNKNNEWGYAPMNGYSNIAYSDLDYNHTLASSQLKEINQQGYYPISEHIQINNYELNDFSNQFEAAVSLDRTTTLINKQEPGTLGKNRACSTNPTRSREEGSKNVPAIMLDLQKELKLNREREEEIKRRNKLIYLKEIIAADIKNKSQLPESSRKINIGKFKSTLPDPTPDLNSSSRNVVQYISEMGFPISRVARAYKMFDGDDKKILEFLVQVQNLEEKNYPGDLVEKALIINKFKLNESLKYLEAMVVLLDLGFDEERAEEALIATNSDRDKALDMLIS